MKSAEIRQKFLAFFAAQQHTIVPSSSLIPGNDPTLMFTNSGMVQFKDTFLGKEKRSYHRATTAQRCVRAGGKHNDLENVGYTARHHTFFEMLGNFSFGDYFKQEAIQFAWQLLTEVYHLPKEKLWVTVYHEDDEAYNIWLNQMHVPAERIIRIGDNKGARYASDNFWQMGDTGPCGPCSEIFYDHGPEIWGGPPGSPEEDGDRYIEIWNLVFMQFERDEQGVLHPLPKPCVDTGMGLERIAAVLQQVHSNYEIDAFQMLIQAAARATHTTDLHHNSLKVIADHIRACSFLVVDGVIPSNEGRGYVLRRIIRRALRHGYKLGQKKPFFHTLVADLCTEMGTAYPELAAQQDRVRAVLLQEEERFGETLENGMKILEQALAQIGSATLLDGKTAFTLYDTFGFPIDLTADICREQSLEVDMEEFERCMQQQREQARAAGKFKAQADLSYDGESTQFQGYDVLNTTAQITALYVDGAAVNSVTANQSAIVVLNNTPFYAESGGQVGDSGWVRTESGAEFWVQDTQKIQADVFGHHGQLQKGTLTVGMTVHTTVDEKRRARIMRNHSATHLLHKALKEVLGAHVQQKGSHVDEHRTRFDFMHSAPLSSEEIVAVEQRVLAEILNNEAVKVEHLAYDAALQSGATALFGEKYADEVRVLTIGFSKELCGGTHVQHTGDIGLCKITLETAVASGVRRLEAVTGEAALAYVQHLAAEQIQLAQLFKTATQNVVSKAQSLLESQRQQEKEIAALREKMAAAAGLAIVSRAKILAPNVHLLVETLDGVAAKDLRVAVETIKNNWTDGVVVLAVKEDNKVSLVAGVSASLTMKVKAGDLVGFVAQQVGGKGGGRPDLAMAGGTQPEQLASALSSVEAWVVEKLAK